MTVSTRFRSGVERNRALIILVAGIIVFCLLAVAVFKKLTIESDLKSGPTLTAQFSSTTKLIPSTGLQPPSKVKIAGSPVGYVTRLSGLHNGIVTVSMKLNPGTKTYLGSAPTATIRPTTALGGTYYVELEPGGTEGAFQGDQIPAVRTKTPLELDTVLQAVPQQARASMQQALPELDQSLQSAGAPALGQLLAQAPKTLVPTQPVAQALLGQDPSTDLPNLIVNLDNTATVLTAQNGQLGNIVDLLDQTTGALASESAPLQRTIEDLPQTLTSTRSGLLALQGTLTQLTSTAKAFEPSAQRVSPLLSALNPVLQTLRPLAAQLPPLLQQAQPVVEQLEPTASSADTILDEVKGPVLQEINGPIVGTIVGKWKGLAPKYQGGGNNGHTFYQEAAYLLTNVDRSAQYFDENGYYVNLQAAVGPQSIAGLPAGTRTILGNLLGLAGNGTGGGPNG